MTQEITIETATRVALHGLEVCPECTSVFHKTRVDRKFCSTACRVGHHARAAARGAQIYDLAMDWRLSRGAKKFSDVTALLDKWIPEDRERERLFAEAKIKLQAVKES